MYEQLDIGYYLELQRRFEEIILHVSLHEENYSTYSIKIENLFVDTSAFLDSLCQTFITTYKNGGGTFKGESGVKDFGHKVSGKEYFNINDYREIFETEYGISGFETNLNCHIDAYVGNPIYYLNQLNKTVSFKLIKPFETWASGANPDWWKDYTSLKHNRMDNIKVGNLKNLTLALAGSFIILSLKNESTFKDAQLDKEIYNVFFPNYWNFSGISGARGNALFK